MASSGQLGVIWINQGAAWDPFGYPESTLRLKVLLWASINLKLSSSEPYSAFQISQTPNIAQKLFCIQNLQMDLSFHEKRKTVRNFAHGLQVTKIFMIRENSGIF